MQFETRIEGSTTIITVSGELDAKTAPEVRPTLDQVVESKPAKVRLDLAGLRLVDSTGVGAIVSVFKRIRAQGGSFEVTGVQGQPWSIFQVLRLDKVFGLKRETAP